jgi:nucleoside-diphosphate-sugar epimerase
MDVQAQIENLIITGKGFIGSSLRKYFEDNDSPIKVWTAGRTGSEISITAIVEQNQLSNFGVVLSGWSGVATSKSMDLEVQTQSLREFEKQLGEVVSLRPSITLGFGSQIEKAGLNANGTDEITSYASAKIEARKKFVEAMRGSNLVGKWIYIYSVYGPDMQDSWLLPQLIKASLSGTNVDMGECLQKWGLLHISDFSRAIELIVSKPSFFPLELDLGGNATGSLRELVEEVESILGTTIATFAKKGPQAPDSVPDLGPLKHAGWAQRVTLKQGIQELKDRYA